MLEKLKTASDKDLEQLTSLFRLLSDKTRLQILGHLAGGEVDVSTLCADLRLPQPTVSHHLALLRTQNVIDGRRAGKQVFYALNGRVNHQAKLMLQIRTDEYAIDIRPELTSKAGETD